MATNLPKGDGHRNGQVKNIFFYIWYHNNLFCKKKKKKKKKLVLEEM